MLIKKKTFSPSPSKMKLTPLICVQILLAVGVVVSIFTMNVAVLVGTVLMAVVVGCLYWWKNRSKRLASLASSKEVPERINTIRTNLINAEEPSQEEQAPANQALKPNPLPVSYEPLSTRVSRNIAARNLFNNLPEPPNARFEALKSAYQSAGPEGIGLKPAVAHMRNIRSV